MTRNTKQTTEEPPRHPAPRYVAVATDHAVVTDAETALREANAARLAKARYDAVIEMGNAAVARAMAANTKDSDSAAGAALLAAADHVIAAGKRDAPLHSKNKQAVTRAQRDREEYRETASTLGLKGRSVHYVATQVAAELRRRGREVSVRTVERSLKNNL